MKSITPILLLITSILLWACDTYTTEPKHHFTLFYEIDQPGMIDFKASVYPNDTIFGVIDFWYLNGTHYRVYAPASEPGYLFWHRVVHPNTYLFFQFEAWTNRGDRDTLWLQVKPWKEAGS